MPPRMHPLSCGSPPLAVSRSLPPPFAHPPSLTPRLLSHFRSSLYRSLPIFIAYSSFPFGSYSIHVSPPAPFIAFGSAIGFDHVAPPSVLSTTPEPVSTNRCLPSLPNTGPYRPSFMAHTFFHVSPLSLVLMSAPSTSQYSLPSCQRGSAWALPLPTGLYCPTSFHVSPPLVVRRR